jgi:hypothetical protein
MNAGFGSDECHQCKLALSDVTSTQNVPLIVSITAEPGMYVEHVPSFGLIPKTLGSPKQHPA